MHRDEAHRRIPFEDRLRPVAVMHVPIHDDHLALAELLSVACREGHVIEEAEAHGAVGEGVMARGPRRPERGRALLSDPALHGREGDARRGERRFPAAGPQDGVGIERATSPRRQRLEGVEVAGRVHTLQRFPRRWCGLDPLDVGRERRRPQRLQHGRDPLRSLRMPRAGLMESAGGVPDDGRAHAVSCGGVPDAEDPGWIPLRSSWRGGRPRLRPSRAGSAATP